MEVPRVTCPCQREGIYRRTGPWVILLPPQAGVDDLSLFEGLMLTPQPESWQLPTVTVVMRQRSKVFGATDIMAMLTSLMAASGKESRADPIGNTNVAACISETEVHGCQRSGTAMKGSTHMAAGVREKGR